MTEEMTIEQQNEMIALFDGFRKTETHPEYGVAFTRHPTIDVACYPIHELDYHKNWAALMPVVEQIGQMDKGSYGFTVDPWSIEIRDYSKAIEKVLVTIENDDKYPLIDMYYMAVCDFIKWYNKNKQP